MPASSSFSLVGVMRSGNEPITTRLVGLPLLELLFTTTLLDLDSDVDELLDLPSDGPTTVLCGKQVGILVYPEIKKKKTRVENGDTADCNDELSLV